MSMSTAFPRHPGAHTNAAQKEKMADPAKYKRVNFAVPLEMHNQLKAHAAAQGKSIKDFLSEYIVTVIQKK